MKCTNCGKEMEDGYEKTEHLNQIKIIEGDEEWKDLRQKYQDWEKGIL